MRGGGGKTVENHYRRFGGEIYSEQKKLRIKIVVQSDDGVVSEVFVGSYKDPTFRLCPP